MLRRDPAAPRPRRSARPRHPRGRRCSAPRSCRPRERPRPRGTRRSRWRTRRRGCRRTGERERIASPIDAKSSSGTCAQATSPSATTASCSSIAAGSVARARSRCTSAPSRRVRASRTAGSSAGPSSASSAAVAAATCRVGVGRGREIAPPDVDRLGGDREGRRRAGVRRARSSSRTAAASRPPRRVASAKSAARRVNRELTSPAAPCRNATTGALDPASAERSCSRAAPGPVRRPEQIVRSEHRRMGGEVDDERRRITLGAPQDEHARAVVVRSAGREPVAAETRRRATRCQCAVTGSRRPRAPARRRAPAIRSQSSSTMVGDTAPGLPGWMLPLQPSGAEWLCDAHTITSSAVSPSAALPSPASTASRSRAVSAAVTPMASSVSQATERVPSSSTTSAASRSSWVPALRAPSRAMYPASSPGARRRDRRTSPRAAAAQPWALARRVRARAATNDRVVATGFVMAVPMTRA